MSPESNPIATGLMPPTSSSATEAMIEELRRMIRRGNARWKRLVLLEALGLTVATPLAYLWLVFFLDDRMHLNMAGRGLASLIFLLGLVWLAYRLVARWRQAHFTEDQVAIAMERHTPGRIENRLINSIQLARQADGGDAGATEAVVQENCDRLRRIHLEQAARSQPAVMRIGVAGILILMGLLFWAFQRERFTTAATRIFLPFAEVAPVYRTTLTVEPGDVEAKPGDDVIIHIRINGRIPPSLAILQNAREERNSIEVPVVRGTNRVVYTFKAVSQSIIYAVRGGDYVSPFYTINVPTPSELKQLTAVYRYPAYTRLPERKQEGPGGDLAALRGTHVALHFILSEPTLEAVMLLDRLPGMASTNVVPATNAVPATNVVMAAGASSNLVGLALKKVSPNEFETELLFDDLTGYQLQTRQEKRPTVRGKKYDIRVIADQPPELQLTGLDEQAEVMVDSVLPVTLAGKDDYGLRDVGVFSRRVLAKGARETATSNDWTAIKTWNLAEPAAAFQTNEVIAMGGLNVAEGDKIELALRGRDTDPLKGESWTDGRGFVLLIGGAGSALQVLYEQILRTETDLGALVRDQEKMLEGELKWLRDLEPASGLRWDDQKNLDALAASMKEQAQAQSQLRQRGSDVARDMVQASGNLRISVGMLADTEMVRSIRILENVPGRDTPVSKRAALADARLTQDRTLRSLREILEQYVQFRKEWEMANMVPFTKMLAERQDRMKAESLTYAGLRAEAVGVTLQGGTSRRQRKLLELSGLAQTAFGVMGNDTNTAGPIMAAAFSNAAAAFDTSGLKPQMTQAADHLQGGRWSLAATNQQVAAAALATIHTALLKAQVEAARQVLASLQELAASSVEAQKALAQLHAGSTNELLEYDPSKITADELIRMRKLADELKKKNKLNDIDGKFDNYKFEEWMRGIMGTPGKPDFSILKLGDKPSGEVSFPSSSDLKGNKMAIKLLEDKFQDLVGDLLEEADDLRDKYETYNVNAQGQGVEEGNIGKQAGDLNSVSAAAATGNMKPPTKDFGGASRIGRQGARAHGLAIGDESINRRGRDEAQEGQDVMPYQAGQLKGTKSDDPQKDSSTGIGGKEVASSDQNSFSVKDAGEWKDETADKMKAPQEKNQIVERQGKPLNPKIAEMLRDLNSTQEQVIERIKTIKKELDNLYLPTDDLDDLSKQLKTNLDRLKESPDADVYRRQMETLDKLKGAVMVFNRASSEFQPSIVRDQAVKGQILDEPPWQTIPGYEDAVKRYYERLSEQ